MDHGPDSARISRKPVFWVLLALISAGGILFTFRYFSEAFPIVTLDLKMDRLTALEAARELAKRYAWGPQDFSQAASFELDGAVQNYVELEVGGSTAFRALLQERLYSPYTWRVRHFKEAEANETLIRFTPEGTPYGFREKLREEAPGASLKPEDARPIAERSVREHWQIQLEQYLLVESSQETRPGGRIDHTFVYERPDRKIGEGLYRLRLVVGGDRLTELTHFIKVPEAFGRRYEEMRSANNTIAAFASFAMLILYIVGGCAVGLFFLLRQRWVVWRKPLFWGIFIAFLNLLGNISELPLRWMGYDTALSAREFLLRQLLGALGGFLAWALLLTLTFMAAESLTRKAFPRMIQHWKLWARDTACSWEVLGRTVGGYLIVGFDFAFVVAIYFLTTRHFGWWTPSDVLFQPNVLATYLPWLTPISQSLQAGFWEECLFRAVPLAGAALIGDRFGWRKGFLAIAFIVQALIFGAGHANYPSQPAYARVVELIIPSFIFGGIYLVYGLLPAIVSHFVFDVVWFSIPLFVSTASGGRLNQLLVVLLTLAPLWVVLRARWRAGEWKPLPEEHYNSAWQPVAVAVEAPPEQAGPAVVTPVVGARWLMLSGGLGLVLWIVCTGFRQDAAPLKVARVEAVRIARAALEQRGVELSPDWNVLPSVQGGIDQQDRFVWQEGGRSAYRQLMESYLNPPGWNVRFARFEGDIVKRAEEFSVGIVRGGQIVRVQHQLPESAPGPSLPEAEARTIAHSTLRTTFGLDPGKLVEVSAVASKLEKRGDWVFTFSDPQNYPLSQGQARISIRIAGDRVSDAFRFVFVPEEWQRRERSERNAADLIRIACWAAVGLCLLAAAVAGIVQWSRRNFSVPIFVKVCLWLFLTQLATLLNDWPAARAGFSTSEPLSHQVWVRIAGGVVGAALLSIFLALVIGYFSKIVAKPPEFSLRDLWLKGFCVALSLAGCTAVFGKLFSPSVTPEFADYSPATSYLPWLNGILGGVQPWLVGTALTVIVFGVAHRFSLAGTRRRPVLVTLLILAGLVLTGMEEVATVRYWLLSGILLGLLLWAAYYFVLRFNLLVIPVAVAVMLILGTAIQAAYNAFPAALLAYMLQAFMLVVLVHLGLSKLEPRESGG
jgi:hypothetical protein